MRGLIKMHVTSSEFRFLYISPHLLCHNQKVNAIVNHYNLLHYEYSVHCIKPNIQNQLNTSIWKHSEEKSGKKLPWQKDRQRE